MSILEIIQVALFSRTYSEFMQAEQGYICTVCSTHYHKC